MEYAKYISVMLASMLKFIGGPLVRPGPATDLDRNGYLYANRYDGQRVAGCICPFRPGSATAALPQNTPEIIFETYPAGGTGVAAFGYYWAIALLTPLSAYTYWRYAAIAVSFRVSPIRIILTMLLSGIFWALTFYGSCLSNSQPAVAT